MPTPAAVIDVAIAARNCSGMLQAADKLGVLFRPHVKTHKVRLRGRTVDQTSMLSPTATAVIRQHLLTCASPDNGAHPPSAGGGSNLDQIGRVDRGRD